VGSSTLEPEHRGDFSFSHYGAAQLAEPPDADPHVWWCGRGAPVTAPTHRLARISVRQTEKNYVRHNIYRDIEAWYAAPISVDSLQTEWPHLLDAKVATWICRLCHREPWAQKTHQTSILAAEPYQPALFYDVDFGSPWRRDVSRSCRIRHITGYETVSITIPLQQLGFRGISIDVVPAKRM
jgi:hypothetical protein